MKQRKRRFETLVFYNHTGIERHLEKMAKQGWLIEKISNEFWTYRRIEPADLTFTVTYYPLASEFDPEYSEPQKRLHDFCADTGWKLACTWFQMQVFYNEEKDPTPINTDPVLEVDSIHRACKANFLRGFFIIGTVAAVLSFFFLSSLISDTLRLLASPTNLFKGFCFLSLFLLCGVELFIYFRWYRKAKKAAAHEIFLDTPSTEKFQKTVVVLLLIFVALWISDTILTGNRILLILILLMFLVIQLQQLLMIKVKESMKKRKVTKGTNRTLTFIFGFLFAFIMFSFINLGGSRFFENDIRENLPEYSTITPITMADVIPDAPYTYFKQKDFEESSLLTMIEIEYKPSRTEELIDSIPVMEYQLILPASPAFHGFFENQMKRLIVLSEFWKGNLIETDPNPWNAEHAYRLFLDDGTETNRYLVCYKDLLADLQFSWEPTAEQKNTVSQKLDMTTW